MVDVNGALIYVGKARSLRSRLQSYFIPSRPEKAAAIIAETRHLVWEPQPNEFAALFRELELIRRWIREGAKIDGGLKADTER